MSHRCLLVVRLVPVAALAAIACAGPVRASTGSARTDRPDRPDIVSCDLRIQPDFEQKRLALRAVVTIDNPGLASTFEFALTDRYDTLEVREAGGPASVRRNGGAIEVSIARPTARVELTFRLDGAPGNSRGEDRPVIDDTSLFLLWSDAFYPLDLSDWATMTTTLVLPPRFKVVAPGRLISTTGRDGLREHVFRTTNPIVGASVVADSEWIRSERRIGDLTVETYLHPGSERFADRIASTSAEVVRFFSDTFGPYPFDGFRFITIKGTAARRAYPGFVGYSPEYLETEMARTGHDAHETALLWWTYTTRGSDGPHSFQWTEGLGDYAEFLYDERFGKPLPGIFWWFRGRYMMLDPSKEPAWNDIPGNFQDVEHGKLPWLMHVLRYRVGDGPFRQAMKRLFTEYRFREFSMNDFVRVVEDATGRSIAWWRSEWLERKGVPWWALKAEATRETRGYRVRVTVEQGPAIYHLPVEVEIRTATGRSVHAMELTDRISSADFVSGAKPVSVALDPRGWLIARYASGSTLTITQGRALRPGSGQASSAPTDAASLRLQDRAMRLAADWLPGGTAYAPPAIAARASRDGRTVAHGYHRALRARFLRYDPAQVAPQHAALVRLLDDIQAEGTAGQIDKRAWVERPGHAGVAARFVKGVEQAPETIRTMDRILSKMAEESSRARARNLRDELKRTSPMQGHPAGFYMADLIIRQLGRDRLIEHLGNPFRFVALYNEAAQKAGNAPTFSAPSMQFLRTLERRYVPLADRGLKLGRRVM